MSTNHLPQHAAHKNTLDTRVQAAHLITLFYANDGHLNILPLYLSFAMPSISAGSSHSRSSSTITHRCAACCTLFSRPETTLSQSSLKSSRPLPIPPHFAPPVPTLSTPPLPAPSLSTPVTPGTSHIPSCRSQSVSPFLGFTYHLIYHHYMHRSPRPLPKMPRSSPSPHGTPGRGTDMNEQTLPSVCLNDLAGSLSAPQQPANSKEIRLENLSKLQCHPERSAPSNLVPPKLDTRVPSDSSTSDKKHSRDPTLATIIPERLSGVTDAALPILEKTKEEGSETLVRRYSRRWLREERGKRWVEEDYHLVAQFLRELR